MSVRQKNTQIILWIILSFFLLFIITPIFWVIINSFKTNFEIINYPFSLPESWSFANILTAWEMGNFQQYLLNSVIITSVSMLIVFLVACPAGYAFAQLSFKGNNLLFYLFLLGMALPIQTIIVPVFFQIKNIGMINTLTGVILMSVALALPFSIFLMRNTFKDVPKELRESSQMDGAGEWKSFFTIMLPLAKPGVVALLVFTFMNVWNDFLLPLILLMSSDKFTISLGLYSFQGEYGANHELIFAGTLISMIPSILVYFIFQRQFTEGMSAGAIK